MKKENHFSTMNITMPGGFRIHERFTFEKGENARRRHSATRPKVSGKTLFFRERQTAWFETPALQTETTLDAIHVQAFEKVFHGVVGLGDELLQRKAPSAFRAAHIRFVTGAGDLEFSGTVGTLQGRLRLTRSKIHEQHLGKRKKTPRTGGLPMRPPGGHFRAEEEKP